MRRNTSLSDFPAISCDPSPVQGCPCKCSSRRGVDGARILLGHCSRVPMLAALADLIELRGPNRIFLKPTGRPRLVFRPVWFGKRDRLPPAGRLGYGEWPV